MNVIPLGPKSAALVRENKDYLDSMVDLEDELTTREATAEDRETMTHMNSFLADLSPVVLEETGIDLREKKYFLRISLAQLEEM